MCWVRELTCYKGFQSFRYEGPGYLQIFLRAFASFQSKRHAHALKHLDVVVDLKHVIKVKQVLKPAKENKITPRTEELL